MIIRPVQPVTEFTITVSVKELQVLWAVLGQAKADGNTDHMYKAVYDTLVAHGELPTGKTAEMLVDQVTFPFPKERATS